MPKPDSQIAPPRESDIPLALYVHIPWCLRKCPYCDFNSHEIRDGTVPETAYVRALLADLDTERHKARGREVRSVFIGGGTPSLLSGAAMEALLSGIDSRLALAREAEITVEANPGIAERSRFRDFRAAGVNRLSIGVQSFGDEALQRLGRIHDGKDAHAAIDAAQAAGFRSVNIDLMYALPGQSTDDALRDVSRACVSDPGHISHYQLTLEPNTLFARFPPKLPSEEIAWEMHQSARQLLESEGYTRYEVSAYATDGRRCRHNINYWQFGDYLGIGAGAHGKWSAGTVRRSWKQRQPAGYLDCAGTATATAGERQLDRDDLVLEFMLNAFRMTDGFSVALFETRTGLPITAAEPTLSLAESRGMLWRRDGRLGPTSIGQRFLDDLVALFLPDEKAEKVNRPAR